jgi:hypothetical protein
MQIIALLIDQLLGVTDDIDKQNVPDLFLRAPAIQEVI